MSDFDTDEDELIGFDEPEETPDAESDADVTGEADSAPLTLSRHFRDRINGERQRAARDCGARIATRLAAALKAVCGFALFGEVDLEDGGLPVAEPKDVARFHVTDENGAVVAGVDVSRMAARRFLSALMGGGEADVGALRPCGSADFAQGDRIALQRLGDAALRAVAEAAGKQADACRLTLADERHPFGASDDALTVNLSSKDIRGEHVEFSLRLIPDLVAAIEGRTETARPTPDPAKRMAAFADHIPVRLSCRVAHGEIALSALDNVAAGDLIPIERPPLATLRVGSVDIAACIPGRRAGRRAVSIHIAEDHHA